jgi:hypothetical protein
MWIRTTLFSLIILCCSWTNLPDYGKIPRGELVDLAIILSNPFPKI